MLPFCHVAVHFEGRPTFTQPLEGTVWITVRNTVIIFSHSLTLAYTHARLHTLSLSLPLLHDYVQEAYGG